MAVYPAGVTQPDRDGWLSRPLPTIEEWARGWRHTYQNPPLGTVFVYRLFGVQPGIDPADDAAIIYVGVTNSLVRRMYQHAKKWWWLAVDLRLSEAYAAPTRGEALHAEGVEIRDMHPPINRAGRLAEIVSL